MNHYVYEITNLVNGKKYIGKRSCSCSIEQDKYMGSGKILKQAEEKYGINNFSKKILKICNTEEEAYLEEQKYIEQTKAYENSNYYNIHFGGNGFLSSNVKKLWEDEKYRMKVCKSRKEMWENEEYRNKMVLLRKEMGAKESFKEKVSKASKKRWENEEDRNNQLKRLCEMNKNPYIRAKKSNSLKGRKFSNETKEKIRMSNIGKNLGSKSSLSQPVICLNTGEIFESTRLAGNKYNCDNSSISKSCKNVLKKSCGKLNDKPLFWMKLQEFDAMNESKKIDLINKAQNYKFEMTLEQRKSISNHMKKRCGKNHSMAIKIICLNTLEQFDYIKEATKKYGINNTCISNCCKGKQKFAGKINGEPARWMYYEDYLKLNKEVK